MKQIFIVLLLLAPSFAGAMVVAAPNKPFGSVLPWTLAEKPPTEKHKLLDRATKKLWQKRLNKTLFRHRAFDGRGLAISGMIINGLLVLSGITFLILLEAGTVSF